MTHLITWAAGVVIFGSAVVLLPLWVYHVLLRPFAFANHQRSLDRAEFERQEDDLTRQAQQEYDDRRTHEILHSRAPTGAQTLSAIYVYLRTYVAYPSDHAAVAHTLWIAHTWRMDSWHTTPRLAFLSRLPGSGKSRALEVTETLVPNPVLAVNSTPTYLLRRISAQDVNLPTVLYDEIDTVFTKGGGGNETLRGLFNAGYRRGATTGKATGSRIEELQSFAAVAVAGLGNLPDTIMTRSVIIRMQRRQDMESSEWSVQPFRPSTAEPVAQQIKLGLTWWTPTLSIPDLSSDGITDRNADIWEPLLAIADAAGGPWPKLGRHAAKHFIEAGYSAQ